MSGPTDKDVLLSKVVEVEEEIQSCKQKIHDIVTGNFVDFERYLEINDNLHTRADALLSNIVRNKEYIHVEINTKLSSSTEEITALQQQLDKAIQASSVISKLCEIQTLLNAISGQHSERSYTQCAEDITNVNVVLGQLQSAGYTTQDLPILNAIKAKYTIETENLIYTLHSKWGELIKWNSNRDANGKVLESRLCISANNEVITDMCHAMAHLHILESVIKKFSRQLMDVFLLPIIQNLNMTVDSADVKEEAYAIINIKCMGNDELELKESDPAQSLLQDLTQILTFSYSRVLHICLPPDIVSDFGDTTEKNFVSMFSHFVKDEFLLQLIGVALSRLLPVGKGADCTYTDIVLGITTFNKFLVSIGFLNESDCTLKQYVENIEMLAVQKKCGQVCNHARTLYKQVLHETMRSNASELFSLRPDLLTKAKLKVSSEVYEGQAIDFRFPVCDISVSIRDVVQMMYDVLEEATHQSSLDVCRELFSCVRNVITQFCHVVPNYHKQSLTSLPQLSAIHYNNCMFMTHYLQTMHFSFISRLPSSMAQSDVCSFIDLVPIIRGIGTECFQSQINNQRSLLLDFFAHIQNFMDASLKENSDRIDRAINQSLYQLDLLKKVWQSVLPSKVYKKAIGGLVDSVLNNIITKTLLIEDIATDDADWLDAAFTRIQTACTVLFCDETKNDNDSTAFVERQNYAKASVTMSELQLVLKGSLFDIETRWSGGKGPLADHFTAINIKQLIRALFQNTTQRAALLSKIQSV